MCSSLRAWQKERGREREKWWWWWWWWWWLSLQSISTRSMPSCSNILLYSGSSGVLVPPMCYPVEGLVGWYPNRCITANHTDQIHFLFCLSCLPSQIHYWSDCTSWRSPFPLQPGVVTSWYWYHTASLMLYFLRQRRRTCQMQWSSIGYSST